jgi:hypothetical protein
MCLSKPAQTSPLALKTAMIGYPNVPSGGIKHPGSRGTPRYSSLQEGEGPGRNRRLRFLSCSKPQVTLSLK